MSNSVPNIVISYPIGDDDCELQESRREFFTDMSEWADITLVNPEREIPDKLENEPVDLYHMGKRRTEGLNNLQYAQEYGVETINPASGARRVNNRVDTLEMLDNLGIPIPDWDVGKSENIQVELPAVVKTRRETEEGKHEIKRLETDEDSYEGRKLVQELIPHDKTLKLYNVRDQVRTVRLEDDRHEDFVDPRHSTAEEIETPAYIQNYADKIRDETGLDLFEVDILPGGEAIDVNSVPFLADTEDGMDLYESAIRDQLYE